jgi:hypothetical protein
MTFDQVFQLLVLAVVVLVFWWSHRSFPPKQTAELLAGLTTASKETPNQVDDVLVEVAKLLNELRLSNDATAPLAPSNDGEGSDSEVKTEV